MTLHKPLLMLASSTFMVLLAAGHASGPSAEASLFSSDTTPPYFETVPCPWPLPEGAIEGQDTYCGYLHVPLKHSEPDGQTISLAVMVLRASCEDPAPDPIIWIAGGPGSSAIDYFGNSLANSPLRCPRDILLMDQRGFGHSLPAPTCNNLGGVDQGELTDEEHGSLISDELRGCWFEYAQDGLDLSAFNTEESAADLDALRSVLGYEQVNLYGISYGSYLALTVLRDFPSSVRAAVLDGVLPHGMASNWDSQRDTYLAAIGRVTAACEANDSCSRIYPHLSETLTGVVRRLDAAPEDDLGVRWERPLDGETLLLALFGLQYSEGWLPFLPAVIDLADRSTYWPVVLFGGVGERTSAAAWSIGCTDSQNAPGPIFPEPVCSKAGLGEIVFLASDSYRIGAGATMVRQQAPIRTVSSSVRVLLMSGQFDPITPPDYASFAAKTLPNSTVVEFPGLSHGAALTGECPDRILYEFYEAPLDTPDTSCVRDMPPVEFVGPEGLAKLLSGGERMLGFGIINYVLGLTSRDSSAARVLVVSIGLLWALALCTIPHLLVAPLASLLSRILHRPQKPKPPAFIRLTLLWQALSTTFLTFLLIYLFSALLATYMSVPFYLLDLAQPLVLPMPLLIGVTTIASLSSTWGGLKARAWSRTRSSLHVLFAASAACLNVILIALGAIAGLY